MNRNIRYYSIHLESRFRIVSSYEIVRPHHLEAIHKLMYESFHVDEPMTKHLGLNQVGLYEATTTSRVLAHSRTETPWWTTSSLTSTSPSWLQTGFSQTIAWLGIVAPRVLPSESSSMESCKERRPARSWRRWPQ